MKSYRVEFGPFNYTAYYITERAKAQRLISRLTEASFQVGGLDIETYGRKKFADAYKPGLYPHLNKIRLVQLYDGKNVYVFDLREIPLSDLEGLLRKKRWFAHNAVFEIKNLEHRGIKGLDIGCSMILSQIVYNAENSGGKDTQLTEEEQEDLEENPERVSSYRKNGHGLKDVCGRLFNTQLSKDEQMSDWGTAELSREQILYAALDAVVTYHAALLLGKKVVEYKMEKHYKLIKKAQHVASEMELAGMPVDWKAHSKLVEKWDDNRADGQRKCYGYFGDTKLNSSPMMGKWVEKYFKNQPEIIKRWPKTPKGAYSFNASLLSPLKNIEPIKHLLHYKEYQKLVSTYGESLAKFKSPVTGCLHSSFTIGHTMTGRLSSREPNLQNYPREREYRAVFAPGTNQAMIVADFSQIELRLQAEFSQDPVMRKVYKDGGDIYLQMAEKFFRCKVDPTTPAGESMRAFGKFLYLSLGYGMGKAKAVAKCRENGIPLRDDQIIKGWEFYHSLHKVYSGTWCNKVRDQATQLGYARTLFGKMRKIDPNRVWTTAPNHVIQGTAGELMLLAALKVQKLLNGKGVIRNLVHDEALVTCKKENAEEVAALVKEGMCWAMEYMFPKAASFDVTKPKICNSWGQK